MMHFHLGSVRWCRLLWFYFLFVTVSLDVTEAAVTITLAFNTLPGEVAIPESSVNNDVVYNVTATSTASNASSTWPSGIPFSYAISSVNPTTTYFAINYADGAVYLVNPAFNFASGNTQYLIAITVTDGVRSNSSVLTVNITQVPSPPFFSNLPANYTLPETGSTGVAVFFTPDAIDPQGNTSSITYSCTVTPDDGNFQSSCLYGFPEIRHIAIPTFSYAVTPQYIMNITATSTSNLSNTSQLYIYINRTVARTPVLFGLPASVNVSNTQPLGTLLFSDFNATDPDKDPMTINFTCTNGGQSIFLVNGSGVFLKAHLYSQSAQQYVATIYACDAMSCSAGGNLTIKVLKAPNVTYPGAPNAFPLNQTTTVPIVVSGLVWSDPNQNISTYTWQLLTGGSFFAVNTSTGVVTLKTAVDSGTPKPLILSVNVTNTDGLSFIVNVSFTIVCPPTFNSSNYIGNVTDGATVNVVVLSMGVTTCNNSANGPLTYSLGAPANTYFTTVISGANIILKVKTAIVKARLAPSGTVSFNATVTDANGLQGSTNITLTVDPFIDHPPNFTVFNYIFSAPTSALIGTYVGGLQASDPDVGDLVRYIMVDNSSASTYFFIGYLDGQIGTMNNLPGPATYIFHAYVTDTYGLNSTEATITVIVFNDTGNTVLWQINTNGKALSATDIETFKTALQATCLPCTPHVTDYYQDPSTGTWILDVYIATGSNPSSTTYMTKTAILAKYTTDGVKTPTTQAANLVSSLGTVISISEKVKTTTTTTNWWTDTPGGVATICGLSVVGFGLLTTAAVALADVFWWSKRRTPSGYKVRNLSNN